MKNNIWGVVILYNPTLSVLENIKTYINYLDTLLVIDNSENPTDSIVEQLLKIENCIYINNEGNSGISVSLNIAAKKAMQNNIKWLLTMDQDSGFGENDLSIMLDWINNNSTDNIGIVTPMHSHLEINNPSAILNSITMTSGNLLNLKVYNQIGEFMNSLFIDSIDTEYCLRLICSGYKIKRIKDVLLSHKLGELVKIKTFAGTIHTTNHSPLRRYYMIRNRLYIWNKYKKLCPDYVKYEKIRTLKTILKIVLIENNKIDKMKMVFKGYIDYKRGNFGAYQ